MPDERFRIIFEGKERNLEQVLKKIEKAFDKLSHRRPPDQVRSATAERQVAASPSLTA